MKENTGSGTAGAELLVTVTWTGRVASAETSLFRTPGGWRVSFRDWGGTQLREDFLGERWQGEPPWVVMAAFCAAAPEASCPGAFVRSIGVRGATGLEAGLLLLAAADDREGGGGRPLLAALDGLPMGVLEAIWAEEGPWVADGRCVAAPLFDAIEEFQLLTPELAHATVAFHAGDLGVPLEGNVLRAVIEVLAAEQEGYVKLPDGDRGAADDGGEIAYVENVPVSEPPPPRAPVVDPSQVPAPPDRAAIRLDCNGHGELAPKQPAPPAGSAFVASAGVRFELICDTESYWIHPAVDGAGPYQLWGTLDMLEGDSTCCAILEPAGPVTAAEAADTMLRALWRGRFAPAMSLGSFSRGGLLSLDRLGLISHDYLRGNWPVHRAPTMQPGRGDLFYADGALLYRGDLRRGRPHGRGVHYWENGSAWCVGSFRKGEPHGRCRVYFPSRALRYAGLMVDGFPRGRGTEYYDNGRIWFDGIFGRQTSYYGYGARVWVRGRHYDRDGNLVHEGRFTTNERHSRPLVEGGPVLPGTPPPLAAFEAAGGKSAVKRYDGIDYDFRPDSYWSADDPLALILRHVKGSNRRQMIRDYWDAGVLRELDDQLLRDTLTEAERQRLGRIHPSFMGGEYLPDFKVGEEEVVRVQLASVTSDVISVRARPVPGGIAWRAVDEYAESGEYVLTPRLSRGPLSLAELIGMLETATYTDWDLEGGLLLGWNNSNLEGSGSAEELRGFTTIESRFYPELGPHCERVFDDWVVERDGAQADDEDWAEKDEPGDGGEGDEEEDAA